MAILRTMRLLSQGHDVSFGIHITTEKHMASNRTSGALGIATLAALIAGPACAQDSGWYGGINIGQSKAKSDDSRTAGGFLASGFITTSLSSDNRDSGHKLFGGYQFNRHFALEGGYFDLGKFGFSATTVPLGTLNGEMKVTGLNFDAVGLLPLTDKLSLFGRAGLTRAKTEDNFAGTGQVRVFSSSTGKRDTNPKVGLGLQYAFTERLGLRIEGERYRINDALANRSNIDLASIGIVYRFGANASRQPRVETPQPIAPVAPVVVAAPPPPAPVPPPPVYVAPPPVKFALSADSLFDFDKSVVKPAGKQALDKMASDLRGMRYDVIRVSGHTDRIGSPQYNLALSARRAGAVRDYLVGAGLPAEKITASGTGEAEPVTKQSDCKGDKATKQLVACLQPDRRVEVEVSGTK